MLQSLALYLYFLGAKKIHVLQVLIWDFGGWWRFLTVYTHHLYLDFEGAKNIHVYHVLI